MSSEPMNERQEAELMLEQERERFNGAPCGCPNCPHEVWG